MIHIRTQARILLSLLFLPHILPGQSGFQAGYYVNLQQDTIHGWVKNTAGSQSFKKCSFKSDLIAETQVFLPDDILSYGMGEQRVFHSKNLPVNSEKEQVFAELIISGNVDLYQYKDLFFLGFDDSLKELYVREEIVDENQTQIKRKTTEHISILVEAFKGCSELQENISNGSKPVVASLRFLVKLLEEYYACVGEEYYVYKRLPWTKISLGINLGLELSRFTFENVSNTDPVLGADFELVKDFGVGVAFEYASPRISQRLSLRIEPYYSSTLFQGTKYTSNNVRIIRDDFVLSYAELSLPIGVRFIISPNWKSVYVGTGLTPQFYFNRTFKHYHEEEFIDSRSVHFRESINDRLSKKQLGVWIETGLFLLENPLFRMALNLRYQASGNIRNSPFVLDPFNFYNRNQQTSFLLFTGIYF